MTGVAADVGHINTKSIVTGYQPDASGLKEALTGAEVVLIPAGVPRKPGMTRDGMSSRFPRWRNTADLEFKICSIRMPQLSETSQKQLPNPRQMPTSSSFLTR